jgi:hypothetical protein
MAALNTVMHVLNAVFLFFPVKMQVNGAVRGKNIVELVVVAFNNDLLIEKQVLLLQRYFCDAYRYVVADNSTDAACRIRLQQLCRRRNLVYLSVPANPCTAFHESYSHGLVLNWIYRKYILEKSEARYFGFIDHDIFPVKSIRGVKQTLDKHGLLGAVRWNSGCWYLWPGLCFFRKDIVVKKRLDFLPGAHISGLKQQLFFDTGGRNWYRLYHTLQLKQAMNIGASRYFIVADIQGKALKTVLKKKKLTRKFLMEHDLIEHIGPWTHLYSSSLFYTPIKKKYIDSFITSGGTVARSLVCVPVNISFVPWQDSII